MPTLFVACSVKTSKWASDVGLGKHVYKVGVTEADPKEAAATGWAGESDWTIVKAEPAEGLDEDEAINRLEKKERMIDPKLYPKLRGARGVFRLNLVQVENHIVISRALAGSSDQAELKLKPADFAAYLIHNLRR